MQVLMYWILKLILCQRFCNRSWLKEVWPCSHGVEIARWIEHKLLQVLILSRNLEVLYGNLYWLLVWRFCYWVFSWGVPWSMQVWNVCWEFTVLSPLCFYWGYNLYFIGGDASGRGSVAHLMELVTIIGNGEATQQSSDIGNWLASGC